MTKFLELDYSTFLELISFLSDRETEHDDEESKIFAIGKNLNRFIPNITAEASVVLNNLIADVINKNENSEYNFNKFKEVYSYLEFDPNGRSEKKINYSNLVMDSLIMAYNTSLAILEKNNWKDPTEHNVNFQVWNAFTLKCLRNVTPSKTYAGEKALYFKNNKNPYISKKELYEIERECDWLAGKDNHIANKLLLYIKEKKYLNCKTFIEHFNERLRLAYNDTDLEYPETSIFIENLKKLG